MYQSQYQPSFLKALCFFYNDRPLDNSKKVSDCSLPTECALVCKAAQVAPKPVPTEVTVTITFQNEKDHPLQMKVERTRTVKYLLEAYLQVEKKW